MCQSRQVIFNTQEVAKIDENVVQDLKRKALGAPDKHSRLCLHRSLDDPVHEMIIVHCRGAYIRPHKHQDQAESFCMIEGDMLVVLFDDEGNQVDRFRMAERSAGKCFACRIEKSRWHTMVPLSEVVVFLETTSGPFRPDTHNVLAPWSPEASDRAAVDRFVKTILAS